MSSWCAVLTPHAISVLLSVATLVLSSETLFALYPLFAFTPIKSGGLGLSEAAIGAHLSIRAIINIAIMFLFSPMQRRFGTIRTYQMTMPVWSLCIAFFPFLNLLARWEASSSVMNTALCAFFILWGVASIAWPASAIIINDAAPSAETLAAMNGISHMAMLLPEAIAPAFVTSVFALSLSSGILGGNLVWILLLAITSFAAVHCLTLKEPTHGWRQDTSSQSNPVH